MISFTSQVGLIKFNNHISYYRRFNLVQDVSMPRVTSGVSGSHLRKKLPLPH